MAKSEMDPAELVEKALLVQNLSSLRPFLQMSDGQVRDKLTIHFQQRKANRGGDINELIFPLNSDKDVAIVLFEEGKDRESAVQHEQVFHSQLLKVRRFPPVFTSIEATVDPFFVSIMPRGVNMNPSGRVSCLSKAQLNHAERKVIRQVFPKRNTVNDDDFEVAGASNFGIELSSRQHGSLEENEAILRHDEILAKEKIEEWDELNPTSLSKQKKEGPEKFFDAQSDSKETSDDAGVESSQHLGVIVDKYKYEYLQVFESQTLDTLSKKYNVGLQCIEETGDSLRVVVVASNSKVPAENIDKAKEDFIVFYQQASFDIYRKTVDCSLVSRKNVDEAVKNTIALFKIDILVMKVEQSSESRIVLTRGNIEEVVRHFRNAAGIKSGRKLRTTGSSNENNLKSDAVAQTAAFQYAGNPTRSDSATGLHNSSPTSYTTPSHDPRKSGGDKAAHPGAFVTNEGINIVVLEGDITKQSVGAIVNPSTSSLDNFGGVAKAIVRAAGSGVEKKCEEIMKGRRKQYFKVMECVTTSGYNLKCLIIHAIGPTMRNSQYFGVELYNTFLNCLHEANRHKTSSMAIPLIGSGSVRAQKSVCSDILVEALLQFSCDTTSPKFVKDVLLVNIDRESTIEIERSLQKAFAVEHDTAFSVSSSTSTSGAGFSQTLSGEVWGPGVASGVQSVPPGSQQTTAYYDWPKPGESKGQVKEDKHSTNMQPKMQHVSEGNDWPNSKESKEQVKKNQKGSTGGIVANDDAYWNKRASDDADPADKSQRSTGDQGGPLDAKPRAQSADDKKDACPICLEDKMIDAVALGCKHRFCKTCIDQALKTGYRCPVCKAVCSLPKGDQPDGTMSHSIDKYAHLPGYSQDGVITINYCIPGGIQRADHPNTGKYFTGTTRTAYLPDNREGREVLSLLRKAFDAGLVFTVGQSITTGQGEMVTWNDIHHKTSKSGGPQNFGYPDPDYLKRVKEDLAAKGIK